MAKKTARATKPGQQRTKEEQWRKRMAAQARTGAGGVTTSGAVVAEPDETAYSEDGAEMAATAPVAAPAAAPRQRTASVAASNASNARAQAAAAAQRRGGAMYTPRPASRARVLTNTMSIDEEMHFIRGDIRKLVVLTSICIVVLIALAFVLPSIIK